MGQHNPCGHLTMNGTILLEAPHPAGHSNLTQETTAQIGTNMIINQGRVDPTMITCKSCNNPTTGLLQTPHGWVCGNCFKLIYSIPIKPINSPSELQVA
jgi:hypothetical protein